MANANFATSDFMSSAPLSAHWRYAEGSFVNDCYSQGATFLNRLKRALGLPAGGAWDDTLQARLIALVNSQLTADPRWQTVFDALRADASSRIVNEQSLRTGLYVAYYRGSGRRFDAIQILGSTNYPVWNVTPPTTRSTIEIVCSDPSVDVDPAILSASDLSSAASHSTTGVRIESGRSGPSSSTRIISTQKPAVPTWAVILVSLLVAVGAVAVTVRREPPKSEPQKRNKR